MVGTRQAAGVITVAQGMDRVALVTRKQVAEVALHIASPLERSCPTNKEQTQELVISRFSIA